MPVVPDLKTLRLPKFKPFVGFDVGDKTLGIAVSDPTRTFVRPLETLKRGKFSDDVAYLCDMLDKEEVAAIVIGLPLNMDGSQGKAAQKARTFAFNLSQHTDLPITFFDERMSTQAAERAMIEQDMRRSERAEKIDAHAAAYILEGALALMV